MLKGMSFRRDPAHAFDFSDSKKWGKDGASYKLLAPDLEKDRMFAYAELKLLKSVKAPAEDNAPPVGEPAKLGKMYVSGIANANIVDRAQERVDPRGGDFVDYMKNPQFLAHHSYYHPVGNVDQLDVQDDGVHFRAWVGDPEAAEAAGLEMTDMQKEMRTLLAQGVIRTVSIGFIPVKIRAPVYGQNYELLEPMVVEKWELLEISLVAVPCNQDSVIQVRGYSAADDSATIKPDPKSVLSSDEIAIKNALVGLAVHNNVVVSLAFGKQSWNKDSACQLAKTLGFKTDQIVTDEKTVVLQQNESKPNQKLIHIDLGNGVTAVTIKDAGAGNTDNAGDTFQQEALTLLRSMGEMLKKVDASVSAISKKVDAEESSEGDTTPPATTAGTDDAAKTAKRVENLEKNVNDIALALQAIAAKLG